MTSLPPEAALWRQSLRNQNLVGIVSLLCFEYLNTTSPVLKIFFYLSEHSCRMGENLVDLFCHSSHVCVCKCEPNSLHFYCFVDH